MRFCIKCKKPMFTSNTSIWIKNKNFDIHKKCKEQLNKTPKNFKRRKLIKMKKKYLKTHKCSYCNFKGKCYKHSGGYICDKCESWCKK
jgi:hypothetical protein